MKEPKKAMSLYELTKAVHELLDNQEQLTTLVKSMLQTQEQFVKSTQLIIDRLPTKGVKNARSQPKESI